MRSDAADDPGDVPHHAREIGLRVDGVEAPALRFAHLVCDARRFEQRLGGHASGPEAISPEAMLLDQSDLGAERGATGRDDEAARTTTDDDEIELGSCQGSSGQ